MTDSEELITKVRKDIKSEGASTVFYDGIKLYSRRPSSKSFNRYSNKSIGVFTSDDTDADIIDRCCQHIRAYQARKDEQSRLFNETLGMVD